MSVAAVSGVSVLTPKAAHTALPEQLRKIGVQLEQWDVSLPDLRGVDLKQPSAEIIGQIVCGNKTLVQRLYDTRTPDGSFDLFSLSSNTPNLSELQVKFKQVHTHASPEIRLILDGEAFFYIYVDGRKFDVKVEKGTFLFLPKEVVHNFMLTDALSVTALRVFQDPTGWQVSRIIDQP